ncbi:secreted RxLR effector protein 161-like [Nicotiana sylvestris]|uniref:secreted RxLR effector protein 161-like n=1 Tax=Nicotiana sylvestris TaxID=4096 RepID=UPI00388C74B1
MIHQQKYIKKLLKKFNMNSSKSIDTPISIATKLDLDEEGKSVEHKLFSGMIGLLLYLKASRPDIVFSVGLCARFQANPKKSHLKVVKRILRYLKGTPDLCLWYPRGYNFDPVGYADVDYTGFHVDRKFTSGTTHFLGSCLVSWGTKKNKKGVTKKLVLRLRYAQTSNPVSITSSFLLVKE